MTVPSRITDTELAELPLDAGLDALLAELLGQEAATERHRWPLVVAAAASVAAVVAVPTLVLSQGESGPVSRGSAPSVAAQPSATTSAPPEVDPGGPVPQDWAGPSSYAVLEAPGWTVVVDEVTTEPGYGVGVTYQRGAERFTLGWTVQRWYDGLVADARAEGPLSSIDVLGETADYVEYESQQQMAFLPVVDGYGLRVDASFTTPDTFRDLLGRLRAVDQREFAEALPAAVVTPDEVGTVARQMYDATDRPGPVGFPSPVGFNSRYSVAAQVVGPVGCAWLIDYVDARAVGDQAGMASAEQGLVGSRRWAPLVDDLRQPGWFGNSLRAIRADVPDGQVLGSGGCPGSEYPGGGESLIEELEMEYPAG